MKHLYAIILVSAMIFGYIPTQVFAEETTEATILPADNVGEVAGGTCGQSLTWTLDTEGNLIISGTGTMYDYQNGYSPWYSRKDTIKSVIFHGNVTGIGAYAFQGCMNLTGIEIPDSVTYIRHNAFRDCKSLENIRIPDEVTYVGDYAFYHCYKLACVSIGKKVARIGNYAFSMCNITDIYISDPSAWCKIELGTLNELVTGDHQLHIVDSDGNEVTEVVLDDSVTVIPSQHFSNCKNLENIVIPDSVTSIGFRAFEGCSRLRSVSLPESITSISSSMFEDCTGLSEITIPESITSIGSRAFLTCSSLKQITIPSSITSIGDSAFSNCFNLSDVYITDPNAWCNISFALGGRSNPLGNGANLHILDQNGNEMTEVALDPSVTIIPRLAFSNSCITSIMFPDSVTKIEIAAFSGCDSLTDITLPESLTQIETSAFSDCSSLTNITVPDSVKSIGQSAFSGCSGLTTIQLPFVGGNTYGNTPFGHIFGSDSYSGSYHVWQRVSNSEYHKIHYIPKSLTSVTITGGEIARDAFRQCSQLTQITLSDGITKIGQSAFEECSQLERISIPNSVTSIGDYGFSSCINLTEIVFQKDAPTIGANAFKSVYATVSYPANNSTWTSDVMQNYGGSINWIPYNSCDHEYDVQFDWQIDYSCQAVFTCTLCGDIQTTECSVLTHTTPPTFTSTGFTDYQATAFFRGNVYSDYRKIEIPILTPGSHDHGEQWFYDGSGHWKKCSECGQAEFAPHEAGSATENTSARCTVCGYLLELPKGLDWFTDRLQDPDSALYATGFYSHIMEQFGEYFSNSPR